MQEGFNSIEPEITVVVDNHGTGGGFARYVKDGDVDIVDASRAAKPDEESKAKRKASNGRASSSATTALPLS